MKGRSYTASGGKYKYGFNGMEQDEELGEDYTTQYRLYDAGLGRWFSPDPLVYDDETPYSFVSNDPVNMVDPLGLKGGDPKGGGTTGGSSGGTHEGGHSGEFIPTYELEPVIITYSKSSGSYVGSAKHTNYLNSKIFSSAKKFGKYVSNLSKKIRYRVGENSELNVDYDFNPKSVPKKLLQKAQEQAFLDFWTNSSLQYNSDIIIENDRIFIKYRPTDHGIESLFSIEYVVPAELIVLKGLKYVKIGSIFKPIFKFSNNYYQKLVAYFAKRNTGKGKITSGNMGKIIGWGEGQTDEAIQQTINVTKNLTKSQIKGWAKKGLTKSWVQDQLNKYSSSLIKGNKKLKNTQLIHRKELMEKILELW